MVRACYGTEYELPVFKTMHTKPKSQTGKTDRALVKSTVSTIEYWYSCTQGCAPNMIMSHTMLSLTGWA